MRLTPFGKTDKIIGGACTLSYSNPRLISVVGEDFPQETIDLFHQRGISTEGLKSRREKKRFFGRENNTDMNTRDTLDTQLNVLETFNPVVPESYQDCDIP